MKATPRVVFLSAQQYHRACEKLRKAGDAEEATSVGYPCIYLALMASELYMKSMVLRQTGHIPKHHNLQKLFNALPQAVQKSIHRRWDEALPKYTRQIAVIEKHFGRKIDVSISGAFKSAERANESLRYIWEAQPDSFTIIQDLPFILQDVIMNELGQEWLRWDQ